MVDCFAAGAKPDKEGHFTEAVAAPPHGAMLPMANALWTAALDQAKKRCLTRQRDQARNRSDRRFPCFIHAGKTRRLVITVE